MDNEFGSFAGIALMLLALGIMIGGPACYMSHCKAEETKSISQALQSPNLSPETRQVLEKKLVEAVK